MADHERPMRREVRSDDPGLSPDANRFLTDELRAAHGTDEVGVEDGARIGRACPRATLASWRR